MISPENILNWILFVPLVGAVVLLLIPWNLRNIIRLLSNLIMLGG